MDFLSYCLIVFCVLFLYHLYSIQLSSRKLPPGPFVLPFGLGCFPHILFYIKGFNFFQLKPWVMLDTISKKFGDIYCIQLGAFVAVVVSSYEIMVEMANLDEYSQKFAHEAFTYPRTFGKELGLIFVGKLDLWVEMRKFTQRTLREFGFSKRHTMQSAIEGETQAIIKEFNEVITTQGGILNIRNTFVLSVLNVMWCMVAGQRYDHDDPKLVEMMRRNLAMTKSVTFIEPFHVMFHSLKKLYPNAFGESLRLRSFRECHEFTQSLVEERKSLGMYNTNPENFIDVFLSKIEQKKDDKDSCYTSEQLQAMLLDLLQTGTTTTNGTLNYGVLYLLLNPEVQKKCQQEIDTIVPAHLSPTLEDIEKMPYFQAFILEVHRCGNIVPNPIPRIVPKDWNFRGYMIPKGTVIVSNHYSVHMDEKYWGDPHEFRPERFINDKGQYVPDKRVIHFGFGKRLCIGINLVNSVVPIILATLLQNFNFSVVPGTAPPTTEPELGVSLSPMEFPVLISSRKSFNKQL